MLLDILSLHHGRLSLVARGSRSAKSRLRGLLRPFMPLQLSWFIRTDLGTLTGAEVDGGPVTLSGDALMAAYYLNELLLNLLHRHDPQPEIFGHYGATLAQLSESGVVAGPLRLFELDLLGALGYALNLDHDTQTLRVLEPESYYEYRVEQGPVPVERQDGPSLYSGRELLAIRDRDLSDPDVLRSAGRLLRDVIAWHLGGKELKSRRVLRDMMKSRSRANRSENV